MKGTKIMKETKRIKKRIGLISMAVAMLCMLLLSAVSTYAYDGGNFSIGTVSNMTCGSSKHLSISSKNAMVKKKGFTVTSSNSAAVSVSSVSNTGFTIKAKKPSAAAVRITVKSKGNYGAHSFYVRVSHGTTQVSYSKCNSSKHYVIKTCVNGGHMMSKEQASHTYTKYRLSRPKTINRKTYYYQMKCSKCGYLGSYTNAAA